MSPRWVLSGLAAFIAVGALSSFAVSSDHRVSGPESALAARAAIAYVGGQWATIVRPGAPGVAWQFHVVRRDGSATEVLLDEKLELIDVGDSPSFASNYKPQPSGIHVAQSTTRAPLRVPRRAADVPQVVHDRAANAALAATHGGRVVDVDEDREAGAAWEVEVITTDGHSVDVLLDSNFRVIEMGDEPEAVEPTKTGGHDGSHH